MKTLKNHRAKMNIHVNAHISKIMHTPIDVSVCTYVTYANCQTLEDLRLKNLPTRLKTFQLMLSLSKMFQSNSVFTFQSRCGHIFLVLK